MLQELNWGLLTISDVSAFSDSSTDGLWRSDADVYVFNGDELPENADRMNSVNRFSRWIDTTRFAIELIANDFWMNV